MNLINAEFNPFDLEVAGFDAVNKTIKIKLSNELIFLTFEVYEPDLLKIMGYSELNFDEVCKLLQTRIRGKMYSDGLIYKKSRR